MPFSTCLLLILHTSFINTIFAAPADSQIEQPSLIASNGLLLPHTSVNRSTTLNVTSLRDNIDFEYRVPHSPTTLDIRWGFSADWRSLTETVRAAQVYVDAAIDHGHHGFLPPKDDPYREDLGYGVRIPYLYF